MASDPATPSGTPAQQAASKLGFIVLGLGAALGGGALGLFLWIVVASTCGGSDTSEPSSHPLCNDWLAGVVGLGGFIVSFAGPVLGMGLSFTSSRWRPVLIGCGSAIAALAIMYAFVSVVD